MLHLTFLKANQGNRVIITGSENLFKCGLFRLFEICCSSGKMHQLLSKVLSLAWFYTFITSLGGRLRSVFFTLSSLPSFWEGKCGREDVHCILIG